MSDNTILVLDFGAQYSRLIARRVRECKVYSEIVPYNISIKELKKRQPCGLILSGGPSSVYADGAPQINPEVFKLNIPILGICYGMQLMATSLGGRVEHNDISEYGKSVLNVKNGSLLLNNLPKKQQVWMSHKDKVNAVPKGFSMTSATKNSEIASMENQKKKLYGVQFHPEVVHTPYGKDILKSFLLNACDCLPNWTMTSVIENAVKDIKKTVKGGKVICALSGGVDSSVAALLVNKTIGDKLTCVFVDHGLLRVGEADKVVETFEKHLHINLIHIKAEKRFIDKLKGVRDPEKKRVIIGKEFIKVFEEEAKKLKDVDFLVQGTLYPDVIESGSTSKSAKIKTHHNVGGLPEKMNLKLVEPLRLLFKDEVRIVGEELGLPEEIVWRQPFPGPGLAVRIVGEVNRERLRILREADAVVEQEIKRARLYNKIWQAFAVLPCIKSVGVMGDGRTYSYPIAIRAVTSEDAMTADWARIPYKILERMSSRIINEVKGVNRVVYDISSKPPSTIEWE